MLFLCHHQTTLSRHLLVPTWTSSAAHEPYQRFCWNMVPDQLRRMWLGRMPLIMDRSLSPMKSPRRLRHSVLNLPRPKVTLAKGALQGSSKSDGTTEEFWLTTDRLPHIRPLYITANGKDVMDPTYKLYVSKWPHCLCFASLSNYERAFSLANFLLETHHASLDIEDHISDTIPRNTEALLAGGFHGSVIKMARRYAIKNQHTEQKCDHLGATDSTRNSFLRCGGCDVATYFHRECQISHWPLHKMECYGKGIKLQYSKIKES